MANHYIVKKEIGGKEYTAQFAGLSVAQRAIDTTYLDNGKTSTEKLTKYLFEHIIVEPKGLSVDDFDTIDELNAVTNFAMGVMNGEFRNKTDKNATEAKG